MVRLQSPYRVAKWSHCSSLPWLTRAFMTFHQIIISFSFTVIPNMSLRTTELIWRARGDCKFYCLLVKRGVIPQIGNDVESLQPDTLEKNKRKQILPESKHVHGRVGCYGDESRDGFPLYHRYGWHHDHKIIIQPVFREGWWSGVLI